MNKPAESDPVVDPTPHQPGHTTPALEGEAAPRLPHERDESSDSQSDVPRAVIRQAHDDLANGLQDTDRGPVLDDLYENQIRPADEATRDRGAPDPAGASRADRQTVQHANPGSERA